MNEKRKKMKNKRFGDVNEQTLGNLQDVSRITWPNLVEEYEVKGNKLIYKKIEVNDSSAEKIAKIYREGIDEMNGNEDYEWHHDPAKIIQKVNTGNWAFYGCYHNDELIGVESMLILRGTKAIQWVWGCVAPDHRGKGVWQNIGIYNDKLVEMSGAQMGIVWVVTTHTYSQLTAEKAGYRPIGCFVGGEFLGGSDGKYYRQNVIYYAKLYGDGKKYSQNFSDMQLTDSAKKIVNVIEELWTTHEIESFSSNNHKILKIKKGA